MAQMSPANTPAAPSLAALVVAEAARAQAAETAGGPAAAAAAAALIAAEHTTERAYQSSTYARVFPVTDPTGVGATDDANIRAKRAACLAAGGGRVTYQPGTYKLLAPLAPLPGVWDEGVAPTVVPITTAIPGWMANGDFNFAAGTVLQGDGTFACFEANSTDLGAVDTATLGTTQIANWTWTGFGLDGFTYGAHVGAANIMGLVYSKIDQIWVKNCSQLGVKFVNWQELDVGYIFTALCQNGQYWGSEIPLATFAPGNSRFGTLFNITPSDGRDVRLCRGVVFEAGGTAGRLNEITVQRVQSCMFSSTTLTVTATLTNGSTSFAIPDGTKFAPRQIINFTTTALGLTATQMYVVQSVVANTITVGNSFTEAPIAATGNGTITLQNAGYATLELSSKVAGAGLGNAKFVQVDTEGSSSAGVYLENTELCEVTLADIPASALCTLVGRYANASRFIMLAYGTTDFDTNSTTSTFEGRRHVNSLQYALRGHWMDSAGTNHLAVGQGDTGDKGDIETRQYGFLYPRRGFGERIWARNWPGALNSVDAGVVIFKEASMAFDLPTILTDATPAGSVVGVWYDFINVGTGTLTVNTAGGQLFNQVAAKTSLTVAPQTSMKVTAAKDIYGVFFWVARGAQALS